jgi:hypothetical protein
MRFIAEAEMKVNIYTSLKALFMFGGGCSDKGYIILMI